MHTHVTIVTRFISFERGRILIRNSRGLTYFNKNDCIFLLEGVNPIPLEGEVGPSCHILGGEANATCGPASPFEIHNVNPGTCRY